MNERSRKHEQRGADIAEQCVVNDLRKGQLVSLNAMKEQIYSNETHWAEAVHIGFLDKIMVFVGAGEILGVSAEGGDTALIHRLFKARLLE